MQVFSSGLERIKDKAIVVSKVSNSVNRKASLLLSIGKTGFGTSSLIFFTSCLISRVILDPLASCRYPFQVLYRTCNCYISHRRIRSDRPLVPSFRLILVYALPAGSNFASLSESNIYNYELNFQIFYKPLYLNNWASGFCFHFLGSNV